MSNATTRVGSQRMNTVPTRTRLFSRKVICMFVAFLIVFAGLCFSFRNASTTPQHVKLQDLSTPTPLDSEQIGTGINTQIKLQDLTNPVALDLEQAFTTLDKCVESARQQRYPYEEPCERCHSIASPKLKNIKMNFYLEAIRQHTKHTRCKTICEVGFNRGDSALLWLESCNQAQVISFSLDTRWYTQPGKRCMEEQYGERFTYVEGDSLKTVPAFFKANPQTSCDIIHLDGCKQVDCRRKDIENFLPLSHERTLWLTDDLELFCEDVHPSKMPHLCKKVVPHPESKHDIGTLFLEFSSQQKLGMQCIADIVALSGVLDGVCLASSMPPLSFI